MPFTAAHPAIVLPFLRINPRWVSATGLIAGSMSPDFEYFLRMSISSKHGHHLAGTLYFDLPVTILIALLFHQVVKFSLITHLPSFLKSRFQGLLHFNFLQYLKGHFWTFCLSAWFGILSHLFWDAFTHYSGYFVRRIPIYNTVKIPFDGVDYPLFYGLQNISTALGMTLVLVYILFLKSNPVPITRWQANVGYWASVFTISGLILVIRIGFFPVRLNLGNLVVSSISSLLLAFILISFLPSFKNSALHNG